VIDIPVLVIHDEHDAEVPVTCAYHIHENLKNGELMITKKLGHRKILGDTDVIQKSLTFINAN
jgi:pimeloyl-ACP methyl ester carboxylesterase